VETVGGLMVKQLNKVPIAGSVVKYDGLELQSPEQVSSCSSVI
jgi:CBS domain containing-hemolysin-like protein